MAPSLSSFVSPLVSLALKFIKIPVLDLLYCFLITLILHPHIGDIQTILYWPQFTFFRYLPVGLLPPVLCVGEGVQQVLGMREGMEMRRKSDGLQVLKGWFNNIARYTLKQS